jgi:hypothetical protein
VLTVLACVTSSSCMTQEHASQYRNSLNFSERMKNHCSMKNTGNLGLLHGIF